MNQQERRQLILSLFSQYYFGHLNPVFQPWADLADIVRRFGDLSDDHNAIIDLQSELLSLVEQRHPSSKLPVSPGHASRVYQWFRSMCLQEQWPIAEGFLASAKVDLEEPDFVFKTYELDDCSDKRIVLLEENRGPLERGTTGLISWQGAWMLYTWARTFADEIKDRHVLELGSGLGLCGLSLAAVGCGAKSFTFTDCHQRVLDFLGLNARLNFDPEVCGQAYNIP